jgi:23S rRNA G2445 N2-methylase RlmL
MKENEFIATTMFGLENILAGELQELGAQNVRVLNRAVSFNVVVRPYYIRSISGREQQ